MLPDTISPGEKREVPKIDIKPDPTLTEPHTTKVDGSMRSTIGPTLVDDKGNQYKADKATGVITLQTTPDNNPLPQPNVIMNKREHADRGDTIIHRQHLWRLYF